MDEVILQSFKRRLIQLPADKLLWAAGGTAATFVALSLLGQKRAARLFCGWASTLMAAGMYQWVTSRFQTRSSDARTV
jgi:hypothetical protein